MSQSTVDKVGVVLPVRLVYILCVVYIMLCFLGPTVDRVSSSSLPVDILSISCVKLVCIFSDQR
jgi:hypothetical protein